MGGVKNNLLNERLKYNGVEEIQTNIELYSYTTEVVETKTIPYYTDFNLTDKNTSHWIRIDGLTDSQVIKEITKQFGIAHLLTQDILNIKHVAKIEEHEDFVLLVLKYFSWDNKELTESAHQISLVLGENFLISFSEKPHSFMNDILEALELDTLRIRKRGVDYLLSVILNSIIANYTTAILQINDTLEDLEEELLTASSDTTIGAQIQTNRKQYIQIKKAILPLKEQYARLLRTNEELIKPITKIYFNDVNDHLQFVLQQVDICRETLASLVDLYISNNDLKMNNIMKQLTIVATLFIPLTFLVGVWGMNFTNMPELNWKYGYIMAWAIMFIIGIAIYFYFRRKKWH